MGKKDISLATLTAEYLIGLALLSLLAITGYWSVNRHTESLKHDVHIINLSGRHRMLCERITMLALKLINPQNHRNSSKLRSALLASADLMDRSHTELISQDIAIFKPLEPDIHAFIDSTRALAREPARAIDLENPHLKAVTQASADGLTRDLDAALSKIQQNAIARITALMRYEAAMLAAYLALIILISVLIFRPMARRIVEEQDSLREINDNLESIVAERTARIAHLQDNYFHHINHEMRTPITCVYSSLAYLSDSVKEKLDARELGLFEIALRNTSGLNVMIDDLLALTSAELGALKIDAKAFDAAALIQETVESMRLLASPKGLCLDFESAPGLADMLADRDRVRQILTNLIGNAIKFTPPQGRILIKAAPAEEDPSRLELSVSDNGSGIAPEELPRLFERRYQTEEGRREGKAGLGLGLFISKGLVEAQGGRIWAESRKGEGSVFRFTLPRACPSKLILRAKRQRDWARGLRRLRRRKLEN